MLLEKSISAFSVSKKSADVENVTSAANIGLSPPDILFAIVAARASCSEGELSFRAECVQSVPNILLLGKGLLAIFIFVFR